MLLLLRQILLSTALLLPPVAGRVGGRSGAAARRSLEAPRRGDTDAAHYPLKARRAHEATAHWTESELRDKYHLTFNEDSPPKSLEPFLLQLFRTDGDLPDEPTLVTVTTGLETFLTAELNEAFAPTHVVQETQATVVEQRAIANGTALLTQLEVSFEFEPSPERDIVEFWVKSIMANLTWLVSNITAIADGDPELANLTSAHREVYVESEWPGIKDDNTDAPNTSDGSNWAGMPYVIVPTILAGAILVGLVVLLAVHRNEKRRLQQTCFAAPERPSLLLARANLTKQDRGKGRNEGSIDTNLSAYIEEESELYSSETGLMDSTTTDGMARPAAEGSPKDDAIEKSYSGSDIFSGIESTVTSPCGATSNASIFSFFSGLTEPVSNKATSRALTRDKSTGGSYVLGISSRGDSDAVDGQGTPHSKRSNLFAFSEEEESEEEEDDSVILPKEASLCSPRLPYDEAEHPDMAEDFLVDTASMNSEAHQQELNDQSDYTARVAPQVVRAEDEAVSNGTSSPLSADGLSPLSNAKSVENRSIGRANTEIESPRKMSWIQRLSPRKMAKYNRPKQNKATQATEVNLDWSNVESAQRNAAVAAAFVDVVRTFSESPSNEQQTRGRRHAKSTNPDGTQEYQRETMAPHPDWSVDAGTALSPGSGSPAAVLGRTKSNQNEESQQQSQIPSNTNAARDESNVSGLSSVQYLSGSATNSSSLNTTESQPFDVPQSPSQQLYSDLIWLEQKMRRDTFKAIKDRLSPNASDVTGPRIYDSMSSASEPGINPSMTTDTSVSANEGVRISSVSSPRSQDLPRQSIVCRDCIAPPGKLKIIIHSTKDGPAVHTIKEGSALAGKLFPGDLIISVDNVDTRSYSAEQVMKMMTAKSKFERKITVLHFED